VTDWTPIFLSIIALSVFVIAAIQVGAVIAGARLAQRVTKLAEQIQQEMAAQIDADPKLKGTPIVFLTAAVRRHQVEENDGIICDHPCLAKPATVDEVVAMIEKHVRK
jgi:CheY-like chemotaxis protein